MRVLLPLLFLSIPPAGPCPPPPARQEATAEAPRTVRWEPCGMFEPRLPSCRRLRTTRESVLAITDHESFWIDGTSKDSSPMTVEEPGALLADATSWDKHCAEVRVARDGTFRIDADLGEGWRPYPLPAEFRDIEPARHPRGVRSRPCIAGSGDTLVFFADAWIYRFERDAWSRVALELGAHKFAYSPQCALLDGRDLYLGGMDFLGGRLVIANIDNGRAVLESDSFPPGPSGVTDLERGPDGRIYATCAEVSMGGKGGRLLVRDGQHWTELVHSRTTHSRSVCAFGDLVCGNAPPTPPTDTAQTAPSDDPGAFPSSNFEALAFDAEGRAHILCSDLGILRRDRDGIWGCITPGWPESGADAVDLALIGHAAVLASPTAGVVLLDLETLQGKLLRAN